MKVTDYSWYRPDFAEYNVVQASVVPFCDTDTNLVVSFAVATGKTVLAECCFAYHLANDGNVAYVSPYRGLCSEKFNKWQDDVHFSDCVAIHTGDKRSSDAALATAQLTVMTSESFDGRTRSLHKWGSWLGKLNCVVFDEAHMLGDPSRGAAIEASMLRLTEHNPECRLVLLSATMSNTKRVAQWVKSLNNKPTKCFNSDWKPSTVQVERFPVSGRQEMTDQAVNRASVKRGKSIVFVHSKVLGKQLVKRLRKQRVKTVFHNASVSRKKRHQIEKAFNSTTSGLDVIISTSTLGAGVNIGTE